MLCFKTGVKCYTGSKDWIISITARQKNDVCNLTVESHCLQAIKIVYLQHMPSAYTVKISHNVWYFEMKSLG